MPCMQEFVQSMRFLTAKLGLLGAELEGGMGGGGDTSQNTNHLDWQGESSGLAGQSKILNDRM